MRSARTSIVTLSIAALSLGTIAWTACAATSADLYKDMLQAMETEVGPLIDTALPIELEKDPGHIDFDAIRAAAIRVSHVFLAAQNPSSTVYIRSAKKREYAKTAENWFTGIAAAAGKEQKGELVKLCMRKPKICTSCHKNR